MHNIFGCKKYINLIIKTSIIDFKLKDQRSALGFLWSFLNPLILSAVLFFLFHRRALLYTANNYYEYILIGIITWNFFVKASVAGLNSLISCPEVLKNSIFPKEIIVFSSIGALTIQYLFELLAAFIVIIIAGIGFSVHIIFLPLAILTEVLLIAGISLFLSCIAVYIRDSTHVWNALLMAGFFAVPIFYDINTISPELRYLVIINPITQIIAFLRDILLYHRMPSLLNMLYVLSLDLILVGCGYLFFRYNRYKIAEYA